MTSDNEDGGSGEEPPSGDDNSDAGDSDAGDSDAGRRQERSRKRSRARGRRDNVGDDDGEGEAEGGHASDSDAADSPVQLHKKAKRLADAESVAARLLGMA